MSTRDTCLTFYVYESASLCIHRNGALILFHCLKLDVNQGCIYNWDSNSKHLSIDVNVAFFFQSIQIDFLVSHISSQTTHTKKRKFPSLCISIYNHAKHFLTLRCLCGRLYNYNLSLSISRTRRTAVFRVSVVSGLFSVSIGCLLTRHDFLLFFCFLLLFRNQTKCTEKEFSRKLK